MSTSSLIVLTIDGLATRDLGSYGNTWIETPGFNRIGAQSWLAEQMIATQPELPDSLLRLSSADVGRPPLSSAEERGCAAVLATDAPLAALGNQFIEQFDESVAWELTRPRSAAATWEESHAAQFFARLIDLHDSLPERHVLWAHYAGLGTTWDAPLASRVELQLDEEVAAPTWFDPPDEVLDPVRDADRRLEVLWAWAAQVMLVDQCLSVLWSELEQSADTALLIASPRGYALGEHRVVGLQRPLVYGEMAAVPCFAFDGSTPAGWREQALLTTSYLPRLIACWLQGEEFSSQTAVAESAVISRARDTAAIRSGPWMLVRHPDKVELFAKADDRWEANDVSQRCREIADQLSEQLEQAAS